MSALELLTAQIHEALATAARDLWAATGADPFARLGAEPPILVADSTRAALARAGSPLLRLALGAAFSAADRVRATPPADRTAAAFATAAAARTAIAAHLGFPSVWHLALATAGDTDALPDSVAAAAPAAAPFADTAALAAHLADSSALVAALARIHAFSPSALTHISITTADAPEPGRTFILSRADIRIRIWRRPTASDAGTLRVLLHELGHAALATTTDLPSRAHDEAIAARFAAHLEDPTFNASVLGLSPASAAALATSEQMTRAARRARLLTAALTERAFYLSGATSPWQHPLAWTDPGASHAYALAELLRDP